MARKKQAKAKVTPVRQRSQFTCMSSSLMMALQAQGVKCTEDEVNEVMGARPMKGATWEQALAAAQHYGCRATLMAPCTVEHLKKLTDAGIAVMIAWNPEGRDWSHASCVYDVTADGKVYVADPNIPDPDETTRVIDAKDFYAKWYEKWPDYLVRRPAMAIEREITEDGKQVPVRTASMNHRFPSFYMMKGGAMVSKAFVDITRRMVRTRKASSKFSYQFRGDAGYFVPLKGKKDVKALAKLAITIGAQMIQASKKKPQPNIPKKDRNKLRGQGPKPRSGPARGLAERGNSGGGRHHTRDRDVAKGQSRKPKHKKQWDKEASHGIRFAHSGLSHYFEMNLVPYTRFNIVASDGTPVEFSNRAVLAYLSNSEMKHQNTVAGNLLRMATEGKNPNLYLEKVASSLVNAARRRARKDKMPGGIGDKAEESSFDKKQISKGIKVEMEHTSDPAMALEITLDHLTEDPVYYDKLETIEKHSGYKGNPDGEDIYPNEIEHGYDEPVAGGTDVMRQLQNDLLHEQGNTEWQRPESPSFDREAHLRSSSNTATPGEAASLADKWLTKQEE